MRVRRRLSFRTTRRWRVHSATLEKPTGFGVRRGSAAFGQARFNPCRRKARLQRSLSHCSAQTRICPHEFEA
jgi:hypothetical protein